MKFIKRILADIDYMIDDYPLPFGLLCLGICIVTIHHSGSWFSYGK